MKKISLTSVSLAMTCRTSLYFQTRPWHYRTQDVIRDKMSDKEVEPGQGSARDRVRDHLISEICGSTLQDLRPSGRAGSHKVHIFGLMFEKGNIG